LFVKIFHLLQLKLLKYKTRKICGYISVHTKTNSFEINKNFSSQSILHSCACDYAFVCNRDKTGRDFRDPTRPEKKFKFSCRSTRLTAGQVGSSLLTIFCAMLLHSK